MVTGAGLTSRRSPLDLRLLPAALCVWCAALVAVHAPWRVSLSAAAGLGLLALLILLCLLIPPRRSTAAGPGTVRELSRIIGLHLLLCIVAAAAVLGVAGQDLRSQELNGWTAAVQKQAPLQVTLRVLEDAEVLPTPDRSGEPRLLVRATVTHAQTTPEERQVPVGAAVLVMHPLSEGEDPTDVLSAGHRYQGLVRTSELEQGERASAMLFPFGDHALSILPEDRRATVTDAFSALRQATADASATALGDAPALLPGIILGDRSGQDETLTEAMRVSGLTHMTVVSGTHCTLVMGALMGLMRLLRMPRWCTVVLTLLGLLLFVMLVQPAPSVIRAALMGAIGALAIFAGRGRASSALLCLCVLILLLYDPWFSTEPAFQLSVAATAGIVLTGHRLKEIFEQRMPTVIAGPLALACSAQLLVTPVLLPLAAGVTPYSVPANILAGPLLPLVTVPGTLAAVLSTTLPGVSQVLLWAAGVPAAGIGLIGRGSSNLPQALAPWPAGWLGVVLVLLYLAAALILCRLLIAAQWPGRAETGVLVSAAASVLALIVPLTALGEERLPGDWRFALCDVGQGDMLVIRTAAQAGIVVDTGEEPAAAEECLNHLEIEQVEVLMITHEHRDHYGGMPGVEQAADVRRLLYSASAGWQLDEAPEAESVQVSAERARIGDRGIYEGAFPVTWTVWAAADYHRNPNDNSLAVLFEIHEYSAGADGPANDPLRLLSTGDLEQEATDLLLAREALPQHVDVLQVPHHGAANGGTEILEFTRPSVALIGVGEDNSYGHPAPEITGMLQRLESAVYRTDQHGTVVFSYAQGQLETTGIR